MKKLFSYLTSMVFVAGTLFSCSESTKIEEEIIKAPTGEPSLTFEVNISSKDKTRGLTKAEVDTECDKDELATLAQSGDLCSTIQIDGEFYELPVRYNMSTGALIADPIAFELNQTVMVESFMVYECDDPSNILLSAVTEDAPYADLVPKTLPMEVTVTDKFAKEPVDLYVLCSSGEDPEDFGFLMWNINFVDIHCIPFAVNICPDGTHEVGEGLVSVQGFYYDEYGNSTGETYHLVESQPFGAQGPEAELARICVVDNPLVSNDQEYVIITLALQGYQPIVQYVTLDVLLSYQDNINANWNDELNFLHFDFCDCKIWPLEVPEGGCESIFNPITACAKTVWESFEFGYEGAGEWFELTSTGFQPIFESGNYVIDSQLQDYPSFDNYTLLTKIADDESVILSPAFSLTEYSIVYFATNSGQWEGNLALTAQLVNADGTTLNGAGVYDIMYDYNLHPIQDLFDGRLNPQRCYRIKFTVKGKGILGIDNFFVGEDNEGDAA